MNVIESSQRLSFIETALPQPVSSPHFNVNASNQLNSSQYSQNQHRTINSRDLFIAPSFDELDAVAIDGNGEPRCLTNSHLKSLREKG